MSTTVKFSKEHTVLPTEFEQIELQPNVRKLVERIGAPPKLFTFCAKDTSGDAKTTEQMIKEMLSEYLAWLPKETPQATRHLLEAVALAQTGQLVENECGRANTIQVAFLGAAAQHRFTNCLLRTNPKDTQWIVNELPRHTQLFSTDERVKQWKTYLIGAIAVARIIKAIMLSKQRCKLYLPSIYEDVCCSFDLLVELPFSGLYIDIKSRKYAEDAFVVSWKELRLSQNKNKRLENNAFKSNKRYRHTWLPVQIKMSRSHVNACDTRVSDEHVYVMQRIITEANQRYIRGLIPRGNTPLGPVKRRTPKRRR